MMLLLALVLVVILLASIFASNFKVIFKLFAIYALVFCELVEYYRCKGSK